MEWAICMFEGGGPAPTVAGYDLDETGLALEWCRGIGH